MIWGDLSGFSDFAQIKSNEITTFSKTAQIKSNHSDFENRSNQIKSNHWPFKNRSNQIKSNRDLIWAKPLKSLEIINYLYGKLKMVISRSLDVHLGRFLHFSTDLDEIYRFNTKIRIAHISSWWCPNLTKMAPIENPDSQLSIGTIFIKFGCIHLEIWTFLVLNTNH